MTTGAPASSVTNLLSASVVAVVAHSVSGLASVSAIRTCWCCVDVGLRVLGLVVSCWLFGADRRVRLVLNVMFREDVLCWCGWFWT